MPFTQVGDTRHYFFESLKTKGIVHGIFTRSGGVSPEPWASLNVGGTVGDEVGRVKENLIRTLGVFNLNIDTIYDVHQIHSSRVVVTDRPRPVNDSHVQADAILTDQPGITLFMRFADCVPILLYDPTLRVIGIVHAGWVGTVLKTVTGAIEKLCSVYGTNVKDIIAAIGPSIGPDHYSVGEDVVSRVKETFGSYSDSLLKVENGTIKLNLWEANLRLIQEAGVRDIEVSKVCTMCHPDDWYSHRGEMGKTGRFGALIGITR